MTIRAIVWIIAALGIWAASGFYGYKTTLTQKAIQFKERMSKAKELEEKMEEEAKKKAQTILDRAEERAQKIEDQRLKKMEDVQNRLLAREEKMDEKLEKMDEKLEKVEEEKKKITEKEKELDDEIAKQTKKLGEIAKLKKEEAKDALFANIEVEYKKEIAEFIEKLKVIKKEEEDKETAEIIARALPRVATNSVGEFTTKTVDLPNEDYKGKLIWREGRNITFFEKITGVELIVDDTPLLVRLSSFDSEKRFVAAKTLELLIKDGRINPFYIEKIYNQVVNELDDILIAKGKEALTMLNLPMMKPEVVKHIGQYFLRYSYGQNLWNHSIEVAKISEAIATELHLDPILAKKAGIEARIFFMIGFD